jgi:hypothetical protein
VYSGGASVAAARLDLATAARRRGRAAVDAALPGAPRKGGAAARQAAIRLPPLLAG